MMSELLSVGVGVLFGFRGGLSHLDLGGFLVEDGEILRVIALSVDASGHLVRLVVSRGFDDLDAVLNEAGAFVESSGADDAEVLFFVLCAEELDELLVVSAGFVETCLEAFLLYSLTCLVSSSSSSSSSSSGRSSSGSTTEMASLLMRMASIISRAPSIFSDLS